MRDIQAQKACFQAKIQDLQEMLRCTNSMIQDKENCISLLEKELKSFEVAKKNSEIESKNFVDELNERIEILSIERDHLRLLQQPKAIHEGQKKSFSPERKKSPIAEFFHQLPQHLPQSVRSVGQTVGQTVSSVGQSVGQTVSSVSQTVGSSCLKSPTRQQRFSIGDQIETGINTELYGIEMDQQRSLIGSEYELKIDEISKELLFINEENLRLKVLQEEKIEENLRLNEENLRLKALQELQEEKNEKISRLKEFQEEKMEGSSLLNELQEEKNEEILRSNQENLRLKELQEEKNEENSRLNEENLRIIEENSRLNEENLRLTEENSRLKELQEEKFQNFQFPEPSTQFEPEFESKFEPEFEAEVEPEFEEQPAIHKRIMTAPIIRRYEQRVLELQRKLAKFELQPAFEEENARLQNELAMALREVETTRTHYSEINESLQQEIDSLRKELTELSSRESLSESDSAKLQTHPPVDERSRNSQQELIDLRNKVADLEAEVADKEANQQDMYLALFRKGQETAHMSSAAFDMQSVQSDPTHGKPKVHRGLQPQSDGMSEDQILLRFLRDATYYFLVSKEPRDHLLAIMNILKFNSQQRQDVIKARRLNL